MRTCTPSPASRDAGPPRSALGLLARSSAHSRSSVDFLGPPGSEPAGALPQERVPHSEAVKERAELGWHLMWPELKLQLD